MTISWRLNSPKTLLFSKQNFLPQTDSSLTSSVSRLDLSPETDLPVGNCSVAEITPPDFRITTEMAAANAVLIRSILLISSSVVTTGPSSALIKAVEKIFNKKIQKFDIARNVKTQYEHSSIIYLIFYFLDFCIYDRFSINSKAS